MCLFRLELPSTVVWEKALYIYYMILWTGTTLCKFQLSCEIFHVPHSRQQTYFQGCASD